MLSPDKGNQTILFIATNSKDATRLQLEQEAREIAEGLQRSQDSQRFRLEQRLAMRPRDIQRAMLEVEPQIVHFIDGGTGDQGLLFEDEAGNARPIAGDALATLFILFAEQVKGVVLNRCYSPIQGQAIAQNIPWVIGISPTLGSRAAIEFAVTFYDTLGMGRPVEFAHKFGCSALQLEGISQPLMPILLHGSSDKPTSPTAASAPADAPPRTMFNIISDSTLTNLAGAGIHYHTAPAQPQPPADPQPLSWMPEPVAAPPPIAASNPAPVSKPAPQKIEVFFSYSHRDEELRDEMAKHLSILKRQGVIAEWYDRDIGAGSEWAKEIDEHLNSAQVILLLISPDFMASDYCFDVELQRAMERHESGEACVIPVILRPVDWSGAPFGKLQACPKNAKPVTSWTNRDEAFLSVAQAIRKAVERLASH